jgi:hypothetical protein
MVAEAEDGAPTQARVAAGAMVLTEGFPGHEPQDSPKA